MKINSSNSNSNIEKTYGGDRAKKTEHKERTEQIQSGEEQINATGDMVNISSEGVKIQELKSIIDNISDIREDKINSIKEEIEKGEYKVKSDKVAHAIIRENFLDHLL